MTDNRNTILAVILSGLVLIGWQYFYNVPQMEKQRAAQQAQSELAKAAPQAGSTDDARDHARRPAGAAPAANAPAAAGPHGPRRQPRCRDRRRRRASRSTPRGSPAASR